MAPVTRPSMETQQSRRRRLEEWRPQTETNLVFSNQERNTTDGPATNGVQRHNRGAQAELWKGSDEGEGVRHARPHGIVQDMLTPLERTLVQDGHEQLVSEARQVLTGRVANECMHATIEQATGRHVVGWQTEVNPSADRAFA